MTTQGTERIPLEHPLPLRDLVYNALEELIISCKLEPGQRLFEADLAERLGVSRNPVREAMTGLERAGWVESRHRHGTFVRTQDIDEAREFFYVRTVLEVESARLAAKNAEPEALAALRKIVEEADQVLSKGDREAVVRLNSSFHGGFADLGGNRILRNTLTDLDKQLRWYFSSVDVVRGPHSWEEHAHLLDRVTAHDVQGAVRTMRAHASATATEYVKRWQEKYGSAPATTPR